MGGARTLARVATRPRTAEAETDDRPERRWRRRGSSRAADRERPTTLAPASPLPAEAPDRVDALHRRRRTTPPLALSRRRNAPTHGERVGQLGICRRRRKRRENARGLGRGPFYLRARSRSHVAFSDASRASSRRLLRVTAASPGDARSASPRGPAPPRGALARDAPRDRRRRGGGHRGGRVGSAGEVALAVDCERALSPTAAAAAAEVARAAAAAENETGEAEDEGGIPAESTPRRADGVDARSSAARAADRERRRSSAGKKRDRDRDGAVIGEFVSAPRRVESPSPDQPTRIAGVSSTPSRRRFRRRRVGRDGDESAATALSFADQGIGGADEKAAAAARRPPRRRRRLRPADRKWSRRRVSRVRSQLIRGAPRRISSREGGARRGGSRRRTGAKPRTRKKATRETRRPGAAGRNLKVAAFIASNVAWLVFELLLVRTCGALDRARAHTPKRHVRAEREGPPPRDAASDAREVSRAGSCVI